MNYIEGLEILKEIERRHNVMSIKFKGISVWPFLRIYIFQEIAETVNRNSHNISNKKIKTVLKGIAKYNPICSLKKHDIWLFNGCERRKKLGNKYIHRVSGFSVQLPQNILIFEKPDSIIIHHNKTEIEERDIISESWQLLGAHIYEKILRFSPLKIENEQLLISILKDLNASHFNYRYFIRFLWSQKKITDLLLSIFKKPEQVLIECPYNIMGYVWSFHTHNIKVIELQHGVIGKSHYAYTLPHHSILNPDEIWVYGNKEHEFLTKHNIYYANTIIKTGLYYIECANQFFTKDIFADLRKSFRKIVVFAGQNGVVEPVHEFIIKTSQLNPDVFFVYIPRLSGETLPSHSSNLKLIENVNIYEYLKWCDIHSTISSTTCLEATYFGKPTIFYDYQGLSRNYYPPESYITNGFKYISSPCEFKNAIAVLETISNYKFPDLFTKFNINDIINYLNK